MPSPPLISIITVCYNAEKTIEETILSVLEQTYPRIEYIIIDGASNDTTLGIIEKYRDRIDHIISEPDRGYYDGLNKGIKLSRGKWIHQLNADDFYCSLEAIEKAVSSADENKLNYYKMRLLDTDGSVTEFYHKYNRWKMHYSCYVPHPGLLVSREQYSIVGEYDLSYSIGADVDCILRLLKLYDPVPHDHPFVTMRLGGMSSVDPKPGHRDFRDASIKHGTPWAVAYLAYYFKIIRARMTGSYKKYNQDG